MTQEKLHEIIDDVQTVEALRDWQASELHFQPMTTDELMTLLPCEGVRRIIRQHNIRRRVLDEVERRGWRADYYEDSGRVGITFRPGKEDHDTLLNLEDAYTFFCGHAPGDEVQPD